MTIESAAVRWVAANLVATVVPPCGLNTGVTGCLECPHCCFRMHGYQPVGSAGPRELGRNRERLAYECVRCGATFTGSDWDGQ